MIHFFFSIVKGMFSVTLSRANLHQYYTKSTRNQITNDTKEALFDCATFYLPESSDALTSDGLVADTVSFERLLTLATIEDPVVPTFTIIDGPYVYIEDQYYMSFANRFLGGGYLGRGFVQEEILCLEFPEMSMLISNFNIVPDAEGNGEYEILPLADGEYAIFNNLYRTIEINKYASGGFNEIRDELNSIKNRTKTKAINRLESKRFVSQVPLVRVNFLAIDASNVNGREADQEDLDYIRNKLLSSFTGLILRGVDTIHMGKIGTGAFGHKVEDIVALTKEAAIATGMNVIFYLYNGSDREIVEAAFAM